MAETKQDQAPGVDLVDDKPKPTNPDVKSAPKAERDAMAERLEAAARAAAAAVHGPDAYSDPKSPFYLPGSMAEAMVREAKATGVMEALPEPYRMEDGGDVIFPPTATAATPTGSK